MNEDRFNYFLENHRSDLLRVSRATRGEVSLQDVQAEAWLMVADLKSKGVEVDLRQNEHRQLILARLYQHLVRYTELNVRHAIRLDHSPSGADDDVHPLMHLLAADELSDPAVALMHVQDRTTSSDQAILNPHQSLASAYLCLLEHLDNRMTALADHLLISLSYCYRRCAHARIWAACQLPLPTTAVATDRTFIPGAWRHFRLQRQQMQLSLNFVSDDLFC